MFIFKFEEQLKNNISSAIATIAPEIEVNEVEIEKPKKIENGHYSTNSALKLTKLLKKNPREVATQIIDNLSENEYIEKVEIAGPGFINFQLKQSFFQKILEEINDGYVNIDSADKDRYLIEYVSANPTGDLHLGHARNAIYGDSLVRVMRRAGMDVTTEYYINDAGNQMENLGLSVQHFYFELCGIESVLPEGCYRGSDIKRIAAELFAEFADGKVEEPVSFYVEYGYDKNLKEIKRVLAQLNVELQIWTSERSLYTEGKVDKSLDILTERGETYEKDGALWLKSSNYFDDKDRVLRKQDGALTYITPDISYHVDKFERGYNHLIDIWGGDHHGYVARMRSAIKALGKEESKFEVPLIQMVSILSDNVAVKMSKRAGTSVTIKDLLEEIPVDAFRYFFVMRSIETQLDFDIKLAKERSVNNPIYYIQYAHARITTILADSKAQDVKAIDVMSSLSDSEIEIANLLSTYPKVIVEAANKRLPHLICNYLFELASLYHKYYSSERVFSGDEVNEQNKIYFMSKIKVVLKDALDLIGINAVEKM